MMLTGEIGTGNLKRKSAWPFRLFEDENESVSIYLSLVLCLKRLQPSPPVNHAGECVWYSIKYSICVKVEWIVSAVSPAICEMIDGSQTELKQDKCEELSGKQLTRGHASRRSKLFHSEFLILAKDWLGSLFGFSWPPNECYRHSDGCVHRELFVKMAIKTTSNNVIHPHYFPLFTHSAETEQH